MTYEADLPGLSQHSFPKTDTCSRRRHDDSVSGAPERLLEQAPTMSPANRAQPASGLLDNLDEHRADETVVERLWSDETDRRARTIASGEAPLRAWDQLIERIGGLRSSPTVE